MKTCDTAARKRRINLTLNEDLLAQAQSLTDNLSGRIESLLADFLVAEKQRRAADAQLVRATLATWNRFADEHRSFADEHSTL